MEWTQIEGLITYIVIGSAYYLTHRNIWVMFNENRLKGSGDIERHKLKG